MVGKQLELFEGQEISITTDKGIKMINLANSVKVIGLTRKRGKNTVIRWDDVKNKLNTILISPNINENGKNEIEYILNKINHSDSEERKDIFVSIELLLDLCLECKNEKARIFYSYLLDTNKDIKFNPNCPKRKEINFLDKLEQALKPFNITGIRQFPMDINDKHYRIDYYIQNLNIAIEYDENGHKNYSYDKHKGRQKEIEKKLGCKFIRVTDFESDEYNIGLVFKELFNIKAIE